MKTMYKNIIRETYLSKIRPYYDTDYIKAITGLRRSGKSIILQQIKDELLAKGVEPSHILFYDLEGESGEGITTRKKLEGRLHKDIKDNDLYYIFIDEVQHISKFEIAIASVRVSYHCSLFITGSNSKLLRGKLKSRLNLLGQ
ncbi:MAG: AAA family ATPase [Sphaerochaetaceae bacterium]|nr:AAA family ATPase [Sphaerochaetaceae bacterium]